jgi:hypothetical protein
MSPRIQEESEVLGLNGPEGRNVIANLTEKEVRAFFEKAIGWHCVFTNVDTRIVHNLTLPAEQFEEKDRGMDYLFSVFNPFTNRKEGVLVETKHVKTKRSLYDKRLQAYLKALKEKIDGIRASREFQSDPDVQTHLDGAVSYGILVLRFKQFDQDHLCRLCSQIELPLHCGSDIPVIVLLSNDRLSPFIELRRRWPSSSIEFYYPRYMLNSKPIYQRGLSFNYLVSDWILGAVRTDQGRQSFILSFDSPKSEFFQLVYEILCEFEDDVFLPGIDYVFLATGDYESKHLYEQRLMNSSLVEICEAEIITLRQDFNLAYDIAEVLQWQNT